MRCLNLSEHRRLSLSERYRNKYLYAQKLFTDVCDVFIYENKTDQNPVYGSIANIGDEIGGDFIFVKKV